MSNIIHKKLGLFLSVIILGTFAFFPVNQVKAQQSNDFEFAKNLDIFFTLCKELNTNYVDDINPSKLFKTGIDAMLNGLDPYTVYIPESEIEDYRFITTGEYGGIGALIHKQGNWVFIDDPYENSPAVKAGLKAGDKILEINGQSAENKNVEEVSAILKGQPGSIVKILIERPGEPGKIEKDVKREKISVDCVPYYGMVGQQTGYIRLTSFTQTASGEVKNAFLSLKKNPEFKNLIIDIRNNGGGLLTEAVSIVNLFVDKGQNVVSTKGKQPDKNKTYKTSFEPIDTQIPLAILVNGNSASASEILAGALQDLDRAVIIGQRTFGKGLVQNILPLSYNTQMKVTVAKYYIPSGRCIQAIDYSHRNAEGESEHVPDSMIHAFKTLHGRTVFDGKGISPDVKTDTINVSPLAYNLVTRYILYDFVTKFASTHKTIAAPEKYQVNDSLYSDFKAYVGTRPFDYRTQTEKELSDLKKSAESEKYWKDLKDEFAVLEHKMKHNKDSDMDNNRPEIEKMLRYEIVGRYYYQRGQIVTSLSDDPEVRKSIEVFKDKTAFSSILTKSSIIRN